MIVRTALDTKALEGISGCTRGFNALVLVSGVQRFLPNQTSSEPETDSCSKMKPPLTFQPFNIPRASALFFQRPSWFHLGGKR